MALPLEQYDAVATVSGGSIVYEVPNGYARPQDPSEGVPHAHRPNSHRFWGWPSTEPHGH